MDPLFNAIKSAIAEAMDVEPSEVLGLEFSFTVTQEYRCGNRFGEPKEKSEKKHGKKRSYKKRKKRRGRKKGTKNKKKSDVIAGAGAD